QKKVDVAIKRFRAANQQRPEHSGVALGLAQALDASGEIEEAETFARQFIEDHPNDPGLYDFLYSRLFRRNRRDEAFEILELKCARNKDEAGYRVQLAQHHFVMGNPTRADEILQELLERPDQNVTAYNLAGDFYMRVGEFSKAVDVYLAGAEAWPDSRFGLQNKTVEALAVQGKRDEAFELVEQVLAADSKNSQALALRGALKLRTGNREGLEEAISDFESVLARMPDNVVLRYNLAEAYLA
ncbi:MAG: tetratricopeptide repeat protein, partial [bacterium]|nr:tetratricopeptide repeat protein [bacterium]